MSAVKAAETVRLIAEAGGRAFAVGALFGEAGAVDLLFEGLATGLKDHGTEGLDILVNNAGVHSIGSIGQLTEEDFARVLAINVSTPVFVVQRALPLLRDGGRIVNIGSAATRIANPVQIGYTVSKAALAALGPSLANELGRRGITVNTVEPGVVHTDLIGDYAAVPEAVAALESITALGRMGRPEDIADVVAFLAGPQGRWVTGQTIDASGGTYLGPLIPE
ncbi:SDR family NAD(P)-dependent oxidoreductase [Streptomyces parvus]|uniref:SDR family NAD(P)-dependent oxidoreductase n=1 Tax=Streptomyces parvus TaxID=66428 RepID=UPI0035E1498E